VVWKPSSFFGGFAAATPQASMPTTTATSATVRLPFIRKSPLDLLISRNTAGALELECRRARRQ
jgi:hypothetical protein